MSPIEIADELERLFADYQRDGSESVSHTKLDKAYRNHHAALVAGLRALTVPKVWNEEERDGMNRVFNAASEKHGQSESLFAAAVWLLRHRAATLTQPNLTEPEEKERT